MARGISSYSTSIMKGLQRFNGLTHTDGTDKVLFSTMTEPSSNRTVNFLVLFALVSIVLVFSGCRTVVSDEEHALNYPSYQEMTAELTPLEFFASTEIPRIREYYARCTAGLPDARHEAGFFLFEGDRMAVHLFYPPGVEDGEGASGSVVILHGYLSHALDQAAVIRRALRLNFIVVAPELPGHGLSGGVRGGIDDFTAYGRFLAEVTERMAGAAPRPWHVIGHSTGALSVIEYLWNGEDPFDEVVFAAPLVRSYMYNPARLGRFLSRPFIDTVPTQYDSPLGVSRMPLSWFDAQVRWNNAISDRLAGRGVIARHVVVIQGNRDRVVAWRHNRTVINEIFPGSEYHIIRGASHVLFQEEREIRRTALDIAFRHMTAAASEEQR